MNMYAVVLAVARAAVLDTGRQIKMSVLAHSKLEAGLLSEETADKSLDDPCEYTHARSVRLINQPAEAMAAAAMPLAA